MMSEAVEHDPETSFQTTHVPGVGNVKAEGQLIAARPRIRWQAIGLAAWSWVIGIYVLAQVRGQTLAGAATIAAATALGGLIVSAIYLAITPQYNGWALFMMLALAGTVPRSDQIALPLKDELTKRAVDLIILAIVAVAVGLLNRRLDRERRKGATVRSPLWDADVDNPTPG
jgi:hypothetical protein